MLAVWGSPSGAETFIGKLETIGQTNAVVKRALRWMIPSEAGIDVTHPDTIAMIGTLVTANAITEEEATKFLAIGNVKISRASELGLGGMVGDGHVYSARNEE